MPSGCLKNEYVTLAVIARSSCGEAIQSESAAIAALIIARFARAGLLRFVRNDGAVVIADLAAARRWSLAPALTCWQA
jgi:hypothetical protein